MRPSTPIDTPFETIRDIKVGGDFVAFFGGSPTAPEALVKLDLRTGTHALIRATSDIGVDVDDPPRAPNRSRSRAQAAASPTPTSMRRRTASSKGRPTSARRSS